MGLTDEQRKRLARELMAEELDAEPTLTPKTDWERALGGDRLREKIVERGLDASWALGPPTTWLKSAGQDLVDTASALGSAVFNLPGKSIESLEQGTFLKDAADVATNIVKGSVESLAETSLNLPEKILADPIGLVADVSTLLGVGAGLQGGVRAAARAATPLAKATQRAKTAATVAGEVTGLPLGLSTSAAELAAQKARDVIRPTKMAERFLNKTLGTQAAHAGWRGARDTAAQYLIEPKAVLPGDAANMIDKAYINESASIPQLMEQAKAYASKPLSDEDVGRVLSRNGQGPLKIDNPTPTQRSVAQKLAEGTEFRSLAATQALETRRNLIADLVEKYGSPTEQPGMVKLPYQELTANTHTLEAIDTMGLKTAKFGEMTNKYLDTRVLRYLQHVDDFFDINPPKQLTRTLTNVRKMFGTSKVLWNVSSWINATLGNLLHNVVDGGLVGGSVGFSKQLGKEFARVVLNRPRNSQLFQTATKAGFIKGSDLMENSALHKLLADGQREGLKEAFTKSILRVPHDTLGAGLGVIDGMVDLATKGLTGELKGKIFELPRRWQDIFGGLDDASRLATFDRWISRKMQFIGIPSSKRSQFIKAVGDSPELLAEAKANIERFHPNYETVPLMWRSFDKLGLMPFGSYAWKAAGQLVDLAVTKPAVVRGARAAQNEIEKRRSEDERMIMASAPPYAQGRVVPLSDGKAFNFAAAIPYGDPRDVGILARKLSPELGSKGQTGGVVGSAMDILQGRDPQTDRPFSDLLPAFEKGTMSNAVAETVLPVLPYQLARIAAGKHDTRNKEETLYGFLKRSIGKQIDIKVDDQDRTEYKQFTQRRHEILRQMKHEVQQLGESATADQLNALSQKYKDAVKILEAEYKANMARK